MVVKNAINEKYEAQECTERSSLNKAEGGLDPSFGPIPRQLQNPQRVTHLPGPSFPVLKQVTSYR